jgi:ADP-ribose pyrophosphatase YjhB (NUDIX family)
MQTTLYFADHILIFTNRTPDAYHAVYPSDIESFDAQQLIDTLSLRHLVAVVHPDFEQYFQRFATYFTPVTAAGGIVTDAQQRRLMIYRNDRWDLPKGHWEQGESIEECALREVREETGVVATICRPLCQTLHCYHMKGRWEMKRTHWFEMASTATSILTPQHEEGISNVCWCTTNEVSDHLQHTFPTIRRVFESL